MTQHALAAHDPLQRRSWATTLPRQVGPCIGGKPRLESFECSILLKEAAPGPLGHSPDALIATLAQALLREDAGFHAYQMFEAGVRQFHEWGNCDQGRHILIAVVRYLAAHFPTQRALLQTTDIASRLMRGGELHREAQAAE